MPTRFFSGPRISKAARLVLLFSAVASGEPAVDAAPLQDYPSSEAKLFPLTSVRLLESPFSQGVAANRAYLLALDPDRLLRVVPPRSRPAAAQARLRKLGKWRPRRPHGRSYLSALAFISASGSDTPDAELRRRLGYMVSELARCQQASGDGYVGGIPGSRDFWKEVAGGRIEALKANGCPGIISTRLLLDCAAVCWSRAMNRPAKSCSGWEIGVTASSRVCQTNRCRRCSIPNTAA